MQQQLGGRSKKTWEKQPCRYQSQCRRRAGDAPGTEQQFSGAQERPTVEQAASLQPMGSTWSSSPCAARGGAPVQQWMWPEGGYNPWRTSTKTGYWPERQLMVGSPQWSRRSGRAAAIGTYLGAVFEGWHTMEAPHTLELGWRVTIKEQLKWNYMDSPQHPFSHSGERCGREWVEGRCF